MDRSCTDTAILVFARHPEDEARHKNWLGARRHRANTTLASRLFRSICSEAHATGLPVFVIDSTRQQGQSFGERFHHAITTVFAAGFDKVITVGSDCPFLRSHHLLQAASRLDEGLVLGPDHRGGVYLMAIDRKTFDEADLLNIHWQTPVVLKELMQLATVNLLTRLHDLHSLQDIQRLLARIRKPSGLQWLLSFLIQASDHKNLPELPHTRYMNRVHIRRGPPVLA